MRLPDCISVTDGDLGSPITAEVLALPCTQLLAVETLAVPFPLELAVDCLGAEQLALPPPPLPDQGQPLAFPIALVCWFRCCICFVSVLRPMSRHWLSRGRGAMV